MEFNSKTKISDTLLKLVKPNHTILGVEKKDNVVLMRLCDFDTLEVFEYRIGGAKDGKFGVQRATVGLMIQTARLEDTITHNGKRYYVEHMNEKVGALYRNMLDQNIRFHAYEWNGETRIEKIQQ